jgi:hypothetical protein
MSVDIYLTTRQYIPEDSELHTRCRENLKSHTVNHVALCMTHQHSTTNCAMEPKRYRKWEQYDTFKNRCSRYRIHPIRANWTADGDPQGPSYYHQSKSKLWNRSRPPDCRHPHERVLGVTREHPCPWTPHCPGHAAMR